MNLEKGSNREFRKIKSLDFLYEINCDGTIIRNVKSKKPLKIVLDFHHSTKGYFFTFINLHGKVKRIAIHQMVAECWLGERPEGTSVDHIDRNPHNNHYTNLRYATHSMQMKNRQLSQKIIEQATRNCYEWTMKEKAITVKIKSTERNDEKEFPSMCQCSYYLASVYGKSSEYIRTKLKARRSRIYDYDVSYAS